MLDSQTRQRIEDLIASDRVVIFMKGMPDAPRCGFSAQACEILADLVPRFSAFDVLGDESIRAGIKEYGNWPTIPQIYLDGELIGGSDILGQMYNTGELHTLLGIARPERVEPTITVSDAARDALLDSLEDNDGEVLHLKIDSRFNHQFFLKPATGDEIRVVANQIPVHLDLLSAARAQGLQIDWVESMTGSGLKIENPNAPRPVARMSVEELRSRLSGGEALRVFDVRPAADRQIAALDFAEPLAPELLSTLDKQTPIAFLCHYGQTSMRVATQWRDAGFAQVYNIEGGIDAWSRTIDPNVPRY